MAFSPNFSSLIAVTTSSAATRIVDPDRPSVNAARGQQLYLYNSDATALVFIEFGNSDVEATVTTSMCVPPGAYFLINIGTAEYLAVIGSAAASLYVTSGSGA